MKNVLMLCAVTLAVLCPATPGGAEEKKKPATSAGTCPVISKVLQAMRDNSSSETDNEVLASVLETYQERLGKSKSTPEVERKRMFALADLTVRVSGTRIRQGTLRQYPRHQRYQGVSRGHDAA